MNTLKQQLIQLRKDFQLKKQVKQEDNVYEKYRQIRDDLHSLMSLLNCLHRCRKSLLIAMKKRRFMTLKSL